MVHDYKDTIEKECTVCGNNFLAPKITEATRTVWCCSDTCRGHHYRNIKDTQMIIAAIATNSISTLRCSLQRVLDLGFTISISR